MNHENSKEREPLKARMANAANLPKDVVLGAPIVTITGKTELCVENYRGIIEYTEKLVRIQTKTGQLKIHGNRLQIDYYTNDEMKVTGRIIKIEYN